MDNKDIQSLKIAIIGAGMGGLTCALALSKAGFQNIEVYEHASNLGFVGAGIQLAPNLIRCLVAIAPDVWREVKTEAVTLSMTSIRRGATDEELGCVDLAHIETKYGFPHMVGHRSSLANALYKGCKREKAIEFFFSTTASNIRGFESQPCFTAIPRNGDAPYEVEVDVLLGSDGIKSVVRVELLKELGVTTQVENSGQAAYRILLNRKDMEHDPELLDLLDANQVTRWIGERRHIIAYPVSGKTIYNISTAQPDFNFAAGPSAAYTTKGSKSALLSVYDDFCPKLQRMLALVPDGEVCEWKLKIHSPLPTWVRGCIALVGDACHPTLPHLAQGAAQAIKDAAVLGVVLSQLPDPSRGSIYKALLAYQMVRKERAEMLVSLAAQSGRILHLGEGKAKEERDRQFAALKSGKGPLPDKWADADVQRMVYGFDCIKMAGEAIEQVFDDAEVAP